ncbi:hypothetical protein [uncultured Legionella sp.]|uniref:hypothetical protein n=1 Tax=uncultured Legionella sp. TaxID=210934 RepID=UPI0026072E45|nr:hypothetical protein [uncultured Legionella sp.]
MQKKTCRTSITIAITGEPEEVSAFIETLNNYPGSTKDGIDFITIELNSYIFEIWNMNKLRYNLSFHDHYIEKANIIIYINPHDTDIYLCEQIKKDNNLWFCLNFKSIKEIPNNFLKSVITFKTSLEHEKKANDSFPHKWRLIKSGAKTENDKQLNPDCLFNKLPTEITDRILMESYMSNRKNSSIEENTHLFFHMSTEIEVNPSLEDNERKEKKQKRVFCLIQ